MGEDQEIGHESRGCRKQGVVQVLDGEHTSSYLKLPFDTAWLYHGFKNHRTVFRDELRNAPETAEGSEADRNVPSLRINLAQMYFSQPAPKFTQQANCNPHRRINLPSMPHIEAKSGVG